MNKRCPKCGEVKTAEEFGRNAARHDGINSWCKECRKPYSASYFQNNRKKFDRINRAWLAAHPEVKKAQSRRDYLKRRDKILASAKVWRAQNTDKIRARRKVWAEANREHLAALKRLRKKRVRAAPGSHTGDDIKRIFALQKGKCGYCRSSLNKSYHVDHRQPVSRGGSNNPSNLQLLCPSCNLRKKDKDPYEFARECGLLV